MGSSDLIATQGRRNWGSEGRGGMCPPLIIISDFNVPFFKSYIREFSEPHSFSSSKLLASTNIRFGILRPVKIKLVCSVYFHRVHHKILAFLPLISCLISFLLVWRHVINHSKRNFVSSPLHRKDLSCQR